MKNNEDKKTEVVLNATEAWEARQMTIFGSIECGCGSHRSPEECCG